MTRLPRLILVASLAVAGIGLGCAPVTVTTPQGKVAYTADQIVLRINELENAAIQANTTGALDTKTTRTIVSFCVSADTTLKQTPAGWQATVATAWASTKAALPANLSPSLSAVVSSVDVALAALGGQ